MRTLEKRENVSAAGEEREILLFSALMLRTRRLRDFEDCTFAESLRYFCRNTVKYPKTASYVKNLRASSKESRSISTNLHLDVLFFRASKRMPLLIICSLLAVCFRDVLGL